MPLAVYRSTELPGCSRTGQHKPGQIFSVNKECDESDERCIGVNLNATLQRYENTVFGWTAALLTCSQTRRNSIFEHIAKYSLLINYDMFDVLQVSRVTGKFVKKI